MSESNNLVLKRIGTYDLTGNRLGKGNFAYVELATNRVTKSKVAMKVIDTRKIKDEYVKKNILREALLLKKVNHPNIVRLYETLKQHSVYCIVTEFVPGGELLSHVRSQTDSKLSESQARPIMRQLISALYHMHEQGIVHRDLKMENILLDETKKNIKIVDFGLSNICRGDDLLKTQCGSPEYAAPELFRRGCRYGTEVDLWSLGVIMYGIVVGRLPFRSPHFGSRGRNELVDQTSRGLSCTHNKYLILLTPHCRDLLRKLLEPRPELRLPLLDVMVHPWVTLQGTAPLVPYTEQPTDEKLRDKVLGKASQLIKINKSKIAFHVHQKRYDAITGVYNLLLDEELKRVSRSNDCRTIETQHTQENSVIRVSIKTTATEGKETGDQNGTQDSGSASSSEGQDSQPEAEQDWEQVSTRKHAVQKPNEYPVERPLEGLRIRGLRICSNEARYPQNHPHAKTRPNTATPNRTPAESPSKPGGASRAWSRANRTRCKSCIPRFAPKFDSKLHGRRVVMSPRVRQAPEVLASQWESKLQAMISEEEDKGSSHCEEDSKINDDTAEGNLSEKVAGNVQPNKSDVNLEHAERAADRSQGNVGSPLERIGPRNCHLRDTPGVKETLETNRSEGNKGGQTSQTSPKFVSPKGAVRSQKGMPPSSLAAQTINRAVSPLKTSQFVDLADYHKYVPQPPKARITGQLGGVSRLAAKEGENDEQIDSFSAAYQSYLKNNKPQHRRLSIMQAQEILQHESKFHAKYGRRLSTENSESNADSQPENQVSRFRHAIIGTPGNVSVPKKTNEQYSIPKTGCLKGVGLHADQGEMLISGLKRKDNVTPSHDYLVGPNPSADRTSHEDPIKDNLEKPNESRTHSTEADVIRTIQPTQVDTRLNPKQEESLKRQKEKELSDDHEREKVKFLKELEDQKRQKMITEYLQHVYSQYGQQPSPQATSKKTEPNLRTYKVSKQGRVYSVVTRPAEKPGSDVPQVITKPTPILHQAARGVQGDKKISFRPQPGAKGANGVRFFNDWNNSVFTEYINSPHGDTVDGNEKDKLQTKDASFWLEQHLNGVLDETSVARRDVHNYRQLIPRET